jgi:23S rRNA (pseudouridine1915-N3)-methyltransferase
MKIQFWAIGKEHDPYVKTGVAEFTKRINNYYPAQWKITPSPKSAGASPSPDQKKKESDAVLKTLSSHDFLVALDERGKKLDSSSFADFLRKRANESSKNIIFLIGGAYGFHEDVLKRADFTLSLSDLTFPHQLVRLIVAEQVYRACTILKNEKYHHS